MSTESPRQYQYLEPRPGSHYRQLFLKGRRIRADTMYHGVHGPDAYTPEELAEGYDLPLEAVLEALDYVERYPEVIRADQERDDARYRARDLRDGRAPA